MVMQTPPLHEHVCYIPWSYTAWPLMVQTHSFWAWLSYILRDCTFLPLRRATPPFLTPDSHTPCGTSLLFILPLLHVWHILLPSRLDWCASLWLHRFFIVPCLTHNLVRNLEFPSTVDEDFSSIVTSPWSVRQHEDKKVCPAKDLAAARWWWWNLTRQR